MEQNKYDTIYRRLFAKIFDYFVFGMVSWLIIWIFIPARTYRLKLSLKKNEQFRWIENPNATLDFFDQYGELFLSIFLTIYFILCHFVWGQTLGKAITSVKVWDMKEKKSINFLQAFVRNMPDLFYALAIFFVRIEYFPFILLSIWNISNLIQVFSSRKYRSVNDLIAKTVVLRVKKSEN